MKLNGPQKITLISFIAIVILWGILFFNGITEGFYNYFYSFVFGLIPLIGGFVAMLRSRVWGWVRSAVGKAVFYIGLGIFLWGAGEMIWSYYNFFLGVPAPYPSLADLGFAPGILFYGLGAFYLSKATGARFALKSTVAKIFAMIAPVVILVFSYYLLVTVARGGILVPDNETLLKAILDLVYPFGDFISVAIAIVVSGLSFKYLGGKYKFDIMTILLGLAVMFVADTLFSYTTTVGTYYNGNFGDLLLALGMFLLTFGVLGFYKLKEH